jgi:hypothetical protein
MLFAAGRLEIRRAADENPDHHGHVRVRAQGIALYHIDFGAGRAR